MSLEQLHKLTNLTKVLLMILIVVATEYDSNIAIYTATGLWLWMNKIVKIERYLIIKIKGGLSGKGKLP